MEVKELGHLVLYVRNASQSARFYRDVLGFRQVLPGAGEDVAGVAAFSSGRTHHELLLIEVGPDAAAMPEGRRIGLYHFGLKVGDTDEELRQAIADLGAAGATIVGSSDHTVTHSVYLLDPDGNEIEIYIDVAGVDWMSQPALIAAPIRALSL